MIKQGKTIKHYETLRLKKDGTIINTFSNNISNFGYVWRYFDGPLSTIARDITEHRKG